MIRLLDFALLTFLVWLVWSQVIRDWRTPSATAKGHGPGQAPPPDPPGAAAAAREPVTLVPCSVCGVYVPSGRTLPGAAGEVFCSDSCRSRAATRHPV